MNNNVSTDHLTLLARITNRLQAVKELPLAQLELRQPMLVDLLVNLVDVHTDNGKDTDNGWRITAQKYFPMLKEMAGDAGYQFLGAGYFSAAFKHEMLPGKVIKIGFKKEDSGAAYAAFCRANPNTVGLPTIHALARHNSCYSVVLDELQPFPKARFIDDGLQQQYDLAHEIIDENLIEEWRSAYDCGSLNEFEMNLFNTAVKIREFFYGVGSFDLHKENVMLDKYGRLVITDPVSYTNNKLEAVEFDALCAEIAGHKLERMKQVWRVRHNRKHPDTRTREARKWRRKNKKREARKRQKALAAIDLSILEPLAMVHGLPHEAHLEALNAAIEKASGADRQALKAARLGVAYGGAMPNFVHALDAARQREGLIARPLFTHPRLAGRNIPKFIKCHGLAVHAKMFNVPPAILNDAALMAAQRDAALNQLLDARFMG